MLKVLVACEESQAVCKAFRELGHEAYSCDIQECSGGHPEWHIQGDVLPLLNGNCAFQTADTRAHEQVGRWDMIIAFPPCTKTSNAGARHLYKGGKLNMKRFYEGLCGKALIDTILHAECDHIAVENPQPSKVFGFERPTQCIQPFQFGHPYTKKTMLWLKGLPDLVPTKVVVPEKTWCPSGSYSGKHNDKHRGMFTKDRARNRAKTFPGVARAMAVQWSEYIEGGDTNG